MKNKIKQQNCFIAIVLIVITILTTSLIIGIVYLWQVNNSKKPIQQIRQKVEQKVKKENKQKIKSNISEIKPATETLKDLENDINISNWQTYRNEEYGFEFQYPAQWNNPILEKNDPHPGLYVNGGGKEISIDSIWNFNIGLINKGACEGTDCYNLTFKGFVLLPKEGYQDLINNMKKDEIIIIHSTGNEPVEYVKYMAGGMCGYMNALFYEEDRNLIGFTAMCGADEGNEELLEMFNQIFSTFKFIEKEKLSDDQIIQQYYSHITNGELQKAYDMYEIKKIDFEEFEGWYKNTILAEPENIIKLENGTYQFKVKLQDQDEDMTQYKVVMEVNNGKINTLLSEKILDINMHDWQTYRNEEYRFEFKYPLDWKVSKNGLFYPVENKQSRIIFEIFENKERLSVNDWYSLNKKDEVCPISSKLELINDNNILVGYSCGYYFTESYYFANSSLISIVSLSLASYGNPEKYEQIFNSILKSFKFIEKEALTTDWNNYTFELEDISSVDQTISRDAWFFDTRIWKVNKQTSDKSMFVDSTKGSIGNALMNLSIANLNSYNGLIHQIGDKLYLIPYNPGAGIPNSELWELELKNKKFKKLDISQFLGDFGLESWSPDGKKFLDTETDKESQILQVLDIAKDSSKVLKKIYGDNVFYISAGMASFGSAEWIDNNIIKYYIYNLKDFSPGIDDNPEVVGEYIIDIND